MSKIDPDKPLPDILDSQTIAQSQFFHVEQVELKFSNGARRRFERMAGSGRGAVMMVPFLDAERFLLVREYAAGTHSYQLGFPKGLIDEGETVDEAANRELMEEVGFGAERLTPLQSLSMAPTFFNAKMTVMLAEGLYPKRLPGDEPEPLEVIPWSIHETDALLARPDFSEARSVAALLLMEKWISNRQ